MDSVFQRGFKTWCENIAVRVRREMNLNPIDPLDMWQLARHLRILVWEPEAIPGIDPGCLKILLEEDPDSWSAATLRIGSKDLIILNSSHSGGRPASNLAHELSHVLIGHEPGRVDISEDGFLMLNTYDKKQEAEAEWLGGSLLLPRDALLRIRRKRMDLGAAARFYGVSLDKLRQRLDMTGVNRQFERLYSRKSDGRSINR